jgi:hypothetical protein
VTKVPNWHGLVAWDVLLNNLTTGLFLVAALGELAAPDLFTAVANVAYPIALVLLFADLTCLTLDLGDPLRFHHMLRVFKPSSPMSLGVWALTLYSLPLTALVVLNLLPDGPVEWIRKLLVILGLVPALASAVYKGVLFSTGAQPGWKDARWLGGYLTSSAFLMGCAEMLFLAVLLEQARLVAVLRLTLAVLIVLHGIPLGMLLAELRSVLARLYTPRQLTGLAAITLGGGILISLVLVLATHSPLLLVGAVLFLLLGHLVVRFVIVQIPHAPPRPGER